MTFHERVLEFGSVRELLSARCVCNLGRHRVAELAPITDVPMLEQAMGLCREMMSLLRERH